MSSDHAPVSRGSVYMAEYHVKDREVLFRECDETGNLNISFFFKWFEDSRFSIARDSGIMDLFVMKEGNIIFPVVSAQCNFYSPLSCGKTVQVRTTLALDANKRLRFEHRIVDKDNGELFAEGCTQVVAVSAETQKILTADETVRQRIAQYTTDYEEVMG